MVEPILISYEAWAEFEEIIERHIGGGEYYLEKDLRIFCDRHGWHAILRSDDKREFERRARVTRRFAAARRHWAERLAQLNAAAFAHWVYCAGSPEHCAAHQDFDGLVLPPDHAFWHVYYPPNGQMCGCRVRGAHLPGSARRVGGDPDKSPPEWWITTDPETGLPPGIEPLYLGQSMPTLMQFLDTVVNGTDYRWTPDIS